MSVLKQQWKVIIITALVTIIGVFAFHKAEQFIDRTEFCVSCHSMSYNLAELKESTHYGALGVNPKCTDCHVPDHLVGEFQAHVIDGVRSILGELRLDLSTIEKFDEHRPEMAHNARMRLKQWDSSPCRRCHKNPQPSSDSAMAAHKKMETEGATCIDCHQNLVHKAVPEEDLNEGFKQGKIVLKPEKKE